MSQFADIICTKKIMSLPHNSTITFTRSYNYKLTFEIFGTAASEDELRGINRIDGTSRFIEDEVITGTDGFFAYELHGATLKRYSPSIVSLNPFHARYVGELTGNKV